MWLLQVLVGQILLRGTLWSSLKCSAAAFREERRTSLACCRHCAARSLPRMQLTHCCQCALYPLLVPAIMSSAGFLSAHDTELTADCTLLVSRLIHCDISSLGHINSQIPGGLGGLAEGQRGQDYGFIVPRLPHCRREVHDKLHVTGPTCAKSRISARRLEIPRASELLEAGSDFPVPRSDDSSDSDDSEESQAPSATERSPMMGRQMMPAGP